MTLNAGNKRNLERREVRKTETETRIEEGSEVTKSEAETGAIPKEKFDLNSSIDRRRKKEEESKNGNILDMV